MKDYETADFSRDVLDASKTTPVVVDFWAEWCGPCRILGPILERLHEKDAGRWTLMKVDTDRNQDIASRYGVRGIPSVKMIVDGRVVSEFTGAQPERAVRQWLDSSLPDPFQVDLQRAQALMSEGDEKGGIAVLEQVLEKNPSHGDARVLMAKGILPEDPERAMDLISGIEEDSKHFPLADAIRRIADRNEKMNRLAELPEGPAKKSYSSALREIASGNYDSAIEHLIEVIKIDRSYDDYGARKACVALFTLLGEEHEVTRKHRRVFAGALNV
jgi:putative thioredoxin